MADLCLLGWSAALAAVLVATSTGLLVNGYSTDLNSIIFVIAGAFVLLPLALTFDHFFSRHERDQKTGIGMVLMVLHAVLAALIAVGGLATAVFAVVSMAVFTDNPSDLIPVLTSALATLVLFGLIFVRIMRPVTKSRLRVIVRSLLLLLVSGVLVWAIAGPAAQVVTRQQDDRTLRALQNVDYAIMSYMSREAALPEKLQDAVGSNGFDKIGADAIKRSVEDGRLTYTPNVLEPTVVEGVTTRYYEVCATFDFADDSRNQYTFAIPRDERGFAAGLDNISTEAGETCYKMKYVKTDDMVKPL